jgi:hypothetical protein
MRVAIVLAGVTSFLLFAYIGCALAVGSFWREGSVLFSLPWGRLTLADLYLGFSLFSGWVLFREASRARAIAIIVLVMTLGNAFAALYVFGALVGSRGSWPRFWLGNRADEGRA